MNFNPFLMLQYTVIQEKNLYIEVLFGNWCFGIGFLWLLFSMIIQVERPELTAPQQWSHIKSPIESEI